MQNSRSQKFRNKYRIKSIRLQNWDYGWNAAYFVTICTHRRLFHFGDVTDGIMGLSHIGCLAWRFWYEIPYHFPFVNLGAFVVMPNHVHGIVVIDKSNDGCNGTGGGAVETRHCLVSIKTIGQNRCRNQGKNTLSSIIGSYKSVVSKYAHKINPDFAWQSRFYENIIRDDRSYDRISNYIDDNPLRWNGDKFYRTS